MSRWSFMFLRDSEQCVSWPLCSSCKMKEAVFKKIAHNILKPDHLVSGRITCKYLIILAFIHLCVLYLYLYGYHDRHREKNGEQAVTELIV